MPQLPRRERLLLDGDVDPELADYLRAVGFNVELAPRDNPDVIRDDVAVLRYARRRKRIVVCHDKHKDRATEMRLFPEIYNNGGHILRISGDSSQSLMQALGKVTIRYEEWSQWVKENPEGGRIVLSISKCDKTTADEFMKRHLRRIYVNPDELPLPPKRKGHQVRRLPNIPIEQGRLLH